MNMFDDMADCDDIEYIRFATKYFQTALVDIQAQRAGIGDGYGIWIYAGDLPAAGFCSYHKCTTGAADIQNTASFGHMAW